MKLNTKTIIIIGLFVIGNIALGMADQSKSNSGLDGIEEQYHSNSTSITLNENNQWDSEISVSDMHLTSSGDVFVVGSIKARSMTYHFESIGPIQIPGDGEKAFAGSIDSNGEWAWVLIAPYHDYTSFTSIEVHDELGVFIGGVLDTGSGSGFVFEVYRAGNPSDPNANTYSVENTSSASQMILWVSESGVITDQWLGGGAIPTGGSIHDLVVHGSELHAVGSLGASETMTGTGGLISNAHTSSMVIMARFTTAESVIDMKWADLLCDASSSACRGQFIAQKLAIDESGNGNHFVISGWYSGATTFYDSSGNSIELVSQGIHTDGFLVTYEVDSGVIRATNVSTDGPDQIRSLSYYDGEIAVSVMLGGVDSVLSPSMNGSAVIVYDAASLITNSSSIYRFNQANTNGSYVEFFDARHLSSGNILVAAKVYDEIQIANTMYDLDQSAGVVVAELDVQSDWVNSVEIDVDLDSSPVLMDYKVAISDDDVFAVHIESVDDLHVFLRMSMDLDSDGISDSTDNCPNDYNPSQIDTDSNSQGDVCDDDDDGDGVADATDQCILTPGVSAFSGCPTPSITGCMDSIANNFNPSATISGQCDYDLDDDGVNDAEDHCMGVAGNESNGCPFEPVSGCNDTAANNYDSHVNTNNGSCDYDFDDDGVDDSSDICPYVSGTDSEGNPTNDGCPSASIPGCTYPNASNFDSNATIDNGSCIFILEFDDVDGDFVMDVDDHCNGTVEDHDGFEDEDGCPDPDNDGDNITDVNDDCPNIAAPGTATGCPPACEVCEQENNTQELESEDDITNISNLMDDILDGEYNNEITVGGAGIGIGGLIANRMPKLRGRRPKVDIGTIADAKDTYDLIAGAGSKKTAKSIPKKLASDHYMKDGYDRFQSLVDSASPEATEYIPENSDEGG